MDPFEGATAASSTEAVVNEAFNSPSSGNTGGDTIRAGSEIAPTEIPVKEVTSPPSSSNQDNFDSEKRDEDIKPLEFSDEKNIRPEDKKNPRGKTFKAGEVPHDYTEKTQGTPLKRDYSKFKAEDVEVLKKFPNDIFNVVAPRLEKLAQQEKEFEAKQKEFDDLKTNSTSTTFDHPEGYTLAPEYQELTSTYARAEFEDGFLRTQLNLCRQGKPWKAITGWGGEGNKVPIYSEEYNSKTPFQKQQDETQLMLAINKVDSAKQSVQQQATQLQTNYKQQYQQISNDVQTRFDNYIKTLPEDVRPSTEQINNVLKMTHPSLRNLPTSLAAAKAIALADLAMKKLKDYEAKVNTNAKLKLDQRKADPRPASIGNGKKSSDMIDFAETAKEFGSRYPID